MSDMFWVLVIAGEILGRNPNAVLVLQKHETIKTNTTCPAIVFKEVFRASISRGFDMKPILMEGRVGCIVIRLRIATHPFISIFEASYGMRE